MIRLFLAAIGLPAWLAPVIVYGGISLVIASTLGGFYMKGRMDANANCRAAELELQIKGMAELIARYESAKAAAEKLAREETFAAAALEAELDKLRAEIDAEREKAKSENADLEADLAKLIQDKESLNAVLEKLRRRAAPDCTATDSDVDLDSRLRKKRGSP